MVKAVSSLQMTPLDWFWLIILSFAWGGSFALNEVLLEELSPFSIVWARQIIAFCLLLPIALPYFRVVDWNFSLLWRLGVMGVTAVAIPFSLFAIGQQYITSIIAGIGNGTVPLFTLLIAAMWMADERLNKAAILGLVIGFSGILMLFIPMLEAGDFASIWGFGATVFASSLYGFANVFARTIPVVPVLVQALLINFFAALALTPMMLTESPDYFALSTTSIAAMFAQAFTGSFIAYIVYFNLIRRVGSVNTSQVAYFIPFAALILGFFALDEPVSLYALAALSLVLLGLWFKDHAQKSML